MNNPDENDVTWHAVSTLRDDEVDFDEDWLNDAIDQMLTSEIGAEHIDAENINRSDGRSSEENSLRDSLSEKSSFSYTDSQELVFEPEVSLKASPLQVFDGKVFEDASFVGQNLENQSFRGASLVNADFSGVTLKNVDFSGADLSGADFSNAKLDGVDLSGAILRNAKFPKAKLDEVIFNGADLENTDFSDIDPNSLSLEELQALVEYLAKYFPHKLNFALLNLRLLDLKRIDLSRVSLRGADFTGVDFTGVSLVGVNLSECRITPQQIAQALGHPPTPQELMMLLSPKKQDKKAKSFGIDWQDFFFNDKEIGVWDFSKDKGISIDTLVKAGRKVFRHKSSKPNFKETERDETDVSVDGKSQVEIDKEKVIENIERNRQAVLEARKERQKELQNEAAHEENKKVHDIDFSLVRGRGSNER